MELEERSIESLPDACENCATPLTDAEKAAALELAADAPVLCTTCAAEQVPLDEVEAEEV
jgi:hypothetical protein